MTRAIEKAIEHENWKRARTLVRAALRREPASHWLIARFALTYYEEHDYERALAFAEKARDIAPHCPLALWELAGSLDMLGRDRDAIAIYRRLIRRGVESIAFDDCGEGLAWPGRAALSPTVGIESPVASAKLAVARMRYVPSRGISRCAGRAAGQFTRS
jgi:tetratricopeptide (TPR) repeat protein